MRWHYTKDEKPNDPCWCVIKTRYSYEFALFYENKFQNECRPFADRGVVAWVDIEDVGRYLDTENEAPKSFREAFGCVPEQIKLPREIAESLPEYIDLAGVQCKFPNGCESFRRYTGARIFVFIFNTKTCNLSLSMGITEFLDNSLRGKWDAGFFSCDQFKEFSHLAGSILTLEDIVEDDE